MKRISHAIIVFVLATLLLLTSTSIAPAAPAFEQGPFYVGIFGGYVMPQDLSVSDGPDVPLKDSWTLGIKAGYVIPQAKYLAVELEYAYLGTQDIDMSGVDGDFSAGNLMVNFLLRYPEGNYHPYLGVGIGWSMGSFKASEPGVTPIDENDSAFAWQILVGINVDITANWSADLAYRYFASKYSISSGADNFDIDAKNHMILIGVNYHF